MLLASDRIENLKLLKASEMDASFRSECFPNTRRDVIEFALDWVTSPSQVQTVLWLHGIAGSGKSTVSTTIAEYLRELGRLGAFLFFNRQVAALKDPTCIIRTLAYQLASFDARIEAAVCKQIESNPRISESPLRLQITKLLVEPLTSVAEIHTQGPIVIVVDALDECGDEKSRESLLIHLADGLQKLPAAFRIFITSRLESDIKASFDCQSKILALELDVKTESSKTDVLTYLCHNMATLQRRNKYLPLSVDWPGQSRIQSLAERSAGLFIYAATAMKFLRDGHDPDERLGILLSTERREEAESSLDELYSVALCCAGRWDDTTFVSDFRAILGIILVAKIPLTDETIDQMLDLAGVRPSMHTISRLGCVLQWSPGQPIQIAHKSFADFLSSWSRCGTNPWFIETEHHNCSLTVKCLEVMKQELRFNICQLETSHIPNDNVLDLWDRINKFISGHLLYSCIFWADHLQETAFDISILEAIQDFLQLRLLFWLEVLSLIKKVGVAAEALMSTANWIMVCSILFGKYGISCFHQAHNSELGAFAVDACRFVSVFRQAISQSAPHIYLSALPFSPEKSKVAECYLPKFKNTLSVEVGRSIDWPVDSTVLEGHTDGVLSIAYSPDGKQIISGSGDQLRIWDAEKGEVVCGPFIERKGLVYSVAYSPDGKWIVSGSYGWNLCVWDAETGVVVSGPFEGHLHAVSSVAYSPDGKQIVSGSFDHTLVVWDAETGKQVFGPLEMHTGAIYSVAYSPDGKWIVSGSLDRTLRVWDAQTGRVVSGPFEGHQHVVSCVGYSPDGKQIVSGSWDQTVHVWDAETGEVISRPFEGHNGAIHSAVFSPDGKQIVSGSQDHTVCVWDAETGEIVSGPFIGHMGPVYSVVFSPDGK